MVSVSRVQPQQCTEQQQYKSCCRELQCWVALTCPAVSPLPRGSAHLPAAAPQPRSSGREQNRQPEHGHPANPQRGDICFIAAFKNLAINRSGRGKGTNISPFATDDGWGRRRLPVERGGLCFYFLINENHFPCSPIGWVLCFLWQ